MFTAGSNAEHEQAAGGGAASSLPAGYRIEHRAMATLWELYAFGDPGHDCEHAAELAFETVDAIERRLSYFLPDSDIGELNRAAAAEPVMLSAEARACFDVIEWVRELTGGAFDPTVGALLTGRQPWHLAEREPPEGTPPGEAMPGRLGFEAIERSPAGDQAARLSEGVELDLGAIGKGFGVDRALAVLSEWLEGGVMLVAGQSTMGALGTPPGPETERGGLRGDAACEGSGASGGSGGWPIGIRDPRDEATVLDAIGLPGGPEPITVSAAAGGESGHVLDPRTGRPAAAAIGAWVVAPSGALSDAIATAALVMSADQIADCCHREPSLAIARLTRDGQYETHGRWAALRDTLGE